jgi:hypothetical protein
LKFGTVDRHRPATVWYNFVRINSAVKMSPAMAAGVSKTLWPMADIVGLIDAAARLASHAALKREAHEETSSGA